MPKDAITRTINAICSAYPEAENDPELCADIFLGIFNGLTVVRVEEGAA